MTLPASGSISLGQVNTELGVSATATRSLGDSTTRTLFGVPSGAISLSQGYGKANQFAFTISANQTNADLRTLAVNAGWNQSTKVVATIGSGVYVSSNSTGTAGLTVTGSFPGGVELVNNGFIIGMGGSGGNGQPTSGGGTSGSSGGIALAVSVAVSITNSGTIGGGGGGGGGGGSGYSYAGKDATNGRGGGGGGGGRSSSAANSAAGAGGASSGSTWNYPGSAGTAGTVSAAGSGGAGALGTATNNGGAGGGWGIAGTGGSAGSMSVYLWSPTSGGAAGGAVTGNTNITWVATGTRLGAIS